MDQPEVEWMKVDPSIPLAEIEFLTLDDLSPDHCQELKEYLTLKSPGQNPPGTPGYQWQTPKRPTRASQSDLFSFGDATAVFDSLQSGQSHTPVFDVPGDGISHTNVPGYHRNAGPPLSLPPTFMAGIPLPATPAQHIHINNYTANLNFPGHPSAPVSTVPGNPGPSSLPPQPLPFTVGSHYPAPYVAPFPQSSSSPPVYGPSANYPAPPMVVYQPPHLQLTMYPSPTAHYPTPSQGETQQSPVKGHQRTGSSSSTNIMFGSTPVVSVRHSSSDEEGDESTNQREKMPPRVEPHIMAESFNKADHQVHHTNKSSAFRKQEPGLERNESLEFFQPQEEKPSCSKSPSSITYVSGAPQVPQENQYIEPTVDMPQPQSYNSQHHQDENTYGAPQNAFYRREGQNEPHQAPDNQITKQIQSKTDDQISSQNQSIPGKSWASLFNQASVMICPGEKPTARIPPFTPNAGPSIDVSPSERELANYLRSYNLNHIAPAFLPRGLTNRSNWCFVNAILQALLACPPFYNIMKSLPGPGLRAGKIKTPMMDAMVEFVNEFTPLETMNKTMKKDKARRKEDLPTGNPFEPSYIYRCLLNLDSEQFRCVEGRQEDAEEFLTYLLNMISDEMLSLLKLTDDHGPVESPRPEEGTGPEWQEVGARGRSCITRRIADQNGPETPVQQLALGLCRYSVKAASKETSATLQPFFTLQLDIQHPSITSVNQALIQNFASEQLDGYICSDTKQEIEACKNHSLEDLPPILILHLKRFVYDGTTGGCQKVMKNVEFSVDLEIPRDILSLGSKSKYTLKQRQYKLFGVVYHNGREATKGHYIADVYHTGYASWLRCDDSIVTPTVEQLVTAPSPTSVPYILFYRRGDTMVGVEKTVNK